MYRITGDSFAVQTMLMNGLLPIISAGVEPMMATHTLVSRERRS